jgi:hypothetical protein
MIPTAWLGQFWGAKAVYFSQAPKTKTELDALVDELADGLEECLDPSLSREQVIEKVQELSDLATGETPEEEENDED